MKKNFAEASRAIKRMQSLGRETKHLKEKQRLNEKTREKQENEKDIEYYKL